MYLISISLYTYIDSLVKAYWTLISIGLIVPWALFISWARFRLVCRTLAGPCVGQLFIDERINGMKKVSLIWYCTLPQTKGLIVWDPNFGCKKNEINVKQIKLTLQKCRVHRASVWYESWPSHSHQYFQRSSCIRVHHHDYQWHRFYLFQGMLSSHIKNDLNYMNYIIWYNLYHINDKKFFDSHRTKKLMPYSLYR